MATNRTETTTKKIASAKVPTVRKNAVKPVIKGGAMRPVSAAPELVGGKIKVKVVRNFSMPQVEYRKIAEIKEACFEAGLQVKKSEVLRAGLKILSEMNGVQVVNIIAKLSKKKAALQS